MIARMIAAQSLPPSTSSGGMSQEDMKATLLAGTGSSNARSGSGNAGDKCEVQGARGVAFPLVRAQRAAGCTQHTSG